MLKKGLFFVVFMYMRTLCIWFPILRRYFFFLNKNKKTICLYLPNLPRQNLANNKKVCSTEYNSFWLEYDKKLYNQVNTQNSFYFYIIFCSIFFYFFFYFVLQIILYLILKTHQLVFCI